MHGLPIAHKVTESGIDRKAITVTEFRKLCAEYATRMVELQKTGFKRLGVLGDFDNPYLTIDKQIVAEQVRVFAKMVKRGMIFKGLKPVYWSPSSESALAEAEIEHKEKRSPSIYVALKITENSKALSVGEELVI